MQDKSLVIYAFQQFIPYVIKKFPTSIKIICTDNDTKFVNNALSSYFTELDIVHQTSCEYTPQ